DRGDGPVTRLEPWTGHEAKTAACLDVDQDRDIVGAFVGDDEVRPSVGIDVGDGDAGRVGAGEESVAAVERRAELPIAEAGEAEDVVAAGVGDDQVGYPITVQVGQLHRARVDQTG